MRLFSFFAVGILFGIVMTKSEAISWFRIHEMFRFESIHMYGIIGVAVILSAIILWAMKKFPIKTIEGNTITYSPMKFSLKRHILAGTIFGLGWALIGACPGPIFILLGHGYWIFIMVILGAVGGTYAYGFFMKALPH
jgi:uncharacterized membrane protein YedE/YeeE